MLAAHGYWTCTSERRVDEDYREPSAALKDQRPCLVRTIRTINTPIRASRASRIDRPAPNELSLEGSLLRNRRPLHSNRQRRNDRQRHGATAIHGDPPWVRSKPIPAQRGVCTRAAAARGLRQ